MRKLATDELNRLTVSAFKQTPKHPVVLLLDDIRSAHNVGSAFRTADAFLVEKIMLCGITGTPPHREITKTALGADDSVVWEYKKDAREAVQSIKNDGYQIVVVEQTDQSVSLQKMEVIENQKYCFIFGNEVFGVTESLLDLADVCIEIPQFGTKHSLNVSVSIGIVLWEVSLKLAQLGGNSV